MQLISQARCFDGTQFVYGHHSEALSCEMRFAAYLPDIASQKNCPTLFWLSGLTCTEENFISKAGAQRVASELGIIIIAPDTSPRGEAVPDDPESAYDFGLGAGFYVNATEQPWNKHYQMRSYIEDELYNLVISEFPVETEQMGILGHSMGGHGALTIGIRNRHKFKSISAIAPICSPMNCPWGEKALGYYLGQDQQRWREYDACALLEDTKPDIEEIMVDQGEDDNFLKEQLHPQRLQAACIKANVQLQLRMLPGYDHSFYFIASVIEDHLRWHHTFL